MTLHPVFHFFRRRRVGQPARASRLRSSRPLLEALEDRQLLATTMLSAVNQYGDPSVFLLNSAGDVYYNFLSPTSPPAWNGWVALGVGVNGTAISGGTVLVSSTVRPDVFLLTGTGSIYFNSENASGNWNGWTPVAVGVGATAISTGTVPLLNAPYVFFVNEAGSIYYTQQQSNGSWTSFSPVGVGVGAQAISSGTIAISTAPLVYKPYVFELNLAGDVYYTQQNSDGSWKAWVAAGVGVGARAISALNIGNVPYVYLLNGANNIYYNYTNSSGSFVGLAPLAVGLGATSLSSIVADFNNYAFLINGSGGVYSSYGNQGSFSNWFQLVPPSGSSLGAITISTTASGTQSPFAFMIGTDGNVYWDYQTGWATWNSEGWQLVGAQPDPPSNIQPTVLPVQPSVATAAPEPVPGGAPSSVASVPGTSRTPAQEIGRGHRVKASLHRGRSPRPRLQ